MLCVIAVVLVIAIVLGCLELYRDMAWMCAGCRSLKSANWRFGICISDETQVSPLKAWMVEHEVAHNHDWRLILGNHKSMFGISFQHGKAPPVYSLSSECFNEYVRSASDADIREFIDVLKNSGEKDQELFIEKLAEEWLEEKK